MTVEELAGLQRVYRGISEGVALMPAGCRSAEALTPLLDDLAFSLAVNTDDDDPED